MNTTEIILEMQGICKSFPGVKALDNVNFELRKGEVHVLLGENGAGKSTLMKILSGAYLKDAGEISIHGKKVEILNPGHAQELGIGIIYQEFNLNPFLTVAENIFLGREPTIIPGVLDRKKMYKEARKILENLKVDIDPTHEVRFVGVAKQQMVEVAKSLSLNADILIMDEPTAALSNSEIDALFSTIRMLKARGVGIIYISHRLEEIFEIGNRVTVLRDGQYVATELVKDLNKQTMVRLMVARDLNEHIPKVKAPIGEIAMEVKNLCIKDRLKNISFQLRQGEVLGIAGLMGAGRTRLAKALFGAEKLTEGEIIVGGTPLKFSSPRDAINAGIGFVTEDRKAEGLVLELSVKENVTLPNLNQFTRRGVLDFKKERSVVDDYISKLHIKTPTRNQKVLYLSGGNQQKVVLSKWLCSHVRVLIFDEPTRGIDVGAKTEIYQLMNQLTADGVGIIMISSELPEILGMSDRILVMYDGRITAELNNQMATQENIMKHALGEAS
jgi:ribose transport system ATP-binding protein